MFNDPIQVGDTVTVRTTKGVDAVFVTKVEHPISEGDYRMNDIIHVQYMDGQKAMFYRKDIHYC